MRTAVALSVLLLVSMGAALPGGTASDLPSPASMAATPPPGEPDPATSEPTAGPATWIWSADESTTTPAATITRWLTEKGILHHHYFALDMVSFVADSATADALRAEFGGHLTPNESYDLHLDSSVPLIEADRVKQAVGPQRSGPTVMVVDTGVDTLHPDFQGANLAAAVAAERFGGLVVGAFIPDFMVDESGHGTHVSGIVAGSGQALGPSDPLHGRYQGVYSNGRIISFQASTDSGEPQVDSVAALEAFDWALQNQGQFDIRVVTNSWGLPGDLEPRHAINQATKRLYLAGMAVVFSAGNLGGEPGAQLNRFCQAPWVLCVAAGGPDKGLLGLSSRGTSGTGGPHYAHPDITAPGYRITAPDAITNPDLLGQTTGLIGGVTSGQPSQSLYIQRAGTSMAAPHVAGTAALIAAANPDLSPDQIMDILVATVDPMPNEVHEVGTGYLNAREAYNLAVQTEGNLVSFLAGQEVKYAGADSGDPEHRNDPVSVGYTGMPLGGARLLSAEDAPWIGTTVLFWVLTASALLCLLVGFRYQRP